MFNYDPYAELATLKRFAPLEVHSTSVRAGEPLALPHWGPAAGGANTSPQLSWSGAPAEARSYAVTCLDPDAPTGSGFWHWAVYNIPATVTELAENAGAAQSALLPAGAITLPNERRLTHYIGPNPPAGTGVHRYIFAVHALDVAELELDPQSTPAVLGFNLHFHTLARGTITGTATRD